MSKDHDADVEDSDKPPDLPRRVGDDRDRSAEDRDRRAEAHDKASDTRDERAEARDERAEIREREREAADQGAAADRAAALRDRRGGASDRIQAADDREAASADRVLSALERADSSIDELTGTYRRDAGTLELEREIAGAKRMSRPLVLAFVDVDGLKATNDSEGHVAGDDRLRSTAESVRAQLRSYDLIVRFGGDEFVCALVDVSLPDATKRFESVRTTMLENDLGSITVGLAELQEDDSLEGLIARADKALYDERDRRGPPSR